MKFDHKGKPANNTGIQDFINYLEGVKEPSLWQHQGMKVEIDPTVDYKNENVLIRWTDVDEGFNDKEIYFSLAKFQKSFTLME